MYYLEKKSQFSCLFLKGNYYLEFGINHSSAFNIVLSQVYAYLNNLFRVILELYKNYVIPYTLSFILLDR